MLGQGQSEDSAAPAWEYAYDLEDMGLHEHVAENGSVNEEHDGKPSIELLPSVYIPTCDLPVVLERMKQHNAALHALAGCCVEGGALGGGRAEAVERSDRLPEGVVHITQETLSNSEGKTASPSHQLAAKLLSIGGEKVVFQGSDPHIEDLLDKGALFQEEVKLDIGESNRCHTNAADIWGRDVDRFKLVTGYALAGKCWVPHSWVLDGDRLIETTTRRDVYFGIILEGEKALAFWFANFLQSRYPGPCRVMLAHRKAEGTSTPQQKYEVEEWYPCL
jgi:hypothetical protein